MKRTSFVRVLSILLAVVLLSLPVSAETAPYIEGQTSCTTETIYPGVTATEYYLEEGYKYSTNGPQFLRVLEFDPNQEDLALDVVMAGPVGTKKTVSKIVKEFNENNTENKKVVAAVNGDLWMMAQYNSRVEGMSDDPVVKKELCVPRGTDIVDGEIICSQNTQQETPYEEMFQSFGITSDGEPLIGNLRVKLFLTNTTLGTKGFYATGLNRLPANNAIMVYSDKGPISNYCLDDAYEVVIDCDYDYFLNAGSLITGTVTAISAPGSARPTMQENRLILTARGESQIAKLSAYSIGDVITMETTISDTYGNTDKWQTVTEAVGGHYVALLNGEKYCPAGMYRYDPMTLIGFKPDGKIVIIINDGRQSWYSEGIIRHLYAELCLDLGLDSVFLLDGGGSTTLVELAENGYELKNRPSDGATIFTPGIERAVINAVVLSCIKEEVPEEPPVVIMPGDVDGDEKITAKDVNIMKKIVLGSADFADAADLNEDGKCTVADVNAVKKLLLG